MHSTEEMQASKVDFRGYVKALEVEKQKIQVFQRELPLCLELVTQAIERCKQELSDNSTECKHGQSECSEQTSSEGHVFEEFIPMKRTSSSDSDNDDELHESDQQTKISDDDDKNNNGDKKKSDWLRSVQLWNTTSDPPPQKEELPRKALVVEVKRNGGAFQPFHREEKSSSVGKTHGAVVVKSTPLPATSSTTDTGGSGGNSNKKEDKEGQRKQRRNWSPELHRRFLHALQQLGGSHTATPKQIRELMKVDGLTNDEVKSHLQKYRLHTRRPTIHNNNNNGNAQAPQFVVVGGIWVPPQDYNAAVAAANTASGEAARVSAAANGIYAPVASTPSTVTQVSPSVMHRPRAKKPEPSSHSEERTSHSGEGRGHSTSTATSPSSTHTSPVF